MRRDILDWLLDPEDRVIRYRTLVDILDYKIDDKTVLQAKSQIDYEEELDAVIRKAQEDGYWYYTNMKSRERITDRLHYTNLYYFHRILQILAEYQAPIHALGLSDIIETFLDSISRFDNKDLLCPCHYPGLIRPLVMLGYREHAVVEGLIDLLLSSIRWDNGFLCKSKEMKRKRRQVKSCVLGTVPALLAFSELPELWDASECKRTVDYFLNRKLIFATSSDGFVHRSIAKLSFPLGWNILSIIYAVSKLGYGTSGKAARAWKLLKSRQDTEGKYPVDTIYNYWTQKPNRLSDVGRRHQPNKWVTLYVLISENYGASRLG